MTGSDLPAHHVDLTNCDREPIHILGTIQPFGFLMAVSADWIVTRVSDNIGEFLDVTAAEALGRPLHDLFTEVAIHDIRNRLQVLRGPDAVERLFGADLTGDGRSFDVAVHFTDTSVVIIEAEPTIAEATEAAGLVRGILSRLSQTQGMTQFLRAGARQVRALTGFDRVMVYRFDQGGSGEVVAEALGPGIDSFLGLNYPASDIPAQARALYLRNVFRIIADVNAAPVAINPQLDAQGQALDQSLCLLRAVSPIHIEYLHNMGVEASLSISIVVEGRLWGLFACHHYAPLLPSLARRTASELFGQMFSMMLESRERREASDYEARARHLTDRLMASVAQDHDLLDNPDWLGEIVSDTIPCDGVGVYLDGKIALTGLTPDRDQFQALLRVLSQGAAAQLQTVDRIAGLVPEAESYASRAAGLLAIPMSRSPRDYVVLFRAERLRSVRWAGNPGEKTTEFGPNGPRLTPRKSFEEWSELVKGHAAPFTSVELRVGEALRVALLEVVLQLSAAADVERRRAHEKQELLIAELNHRVRNILALIRGLISQTRSAGLSPENFVETLDDRVQALARAHDQITADRWAPASLIDLVVTEGGAYLGGKRDRLQMEGPNVLLEPSAFTTLALVLHELMTNAAKYGALSDSGSIQLSWKIMGDGDLRIFWREIGGPAVTAPTRRGFGSTIIERSIPFDLDGTAELNFKLTGLEAEFSIPARFVTEVTQGPSNAESALSPKPLASDALLLVGRTVLLVEDSMIVALDGEDALRELGAAKVLMVSTATRALELVEKGGIDLGILDVNLAAETSLGVAQRLKEKGVPFLFATGYGDSLDLPEGLKDSGKVKKPYDKVSLAAAISTIAGFGG